MNRSVKLDNIKKPKDIVLITTYTVLYNICIKIHIFDIDANPKQISLLKPTQVNCIVVYNTPIQYVLQGLFWQYLIIF
jgi:hypothetical protein